MSWVDVTSAISTAGATIVALGLGLRSIYLDRRRERDDELRQARLVIVTEPVYINATAERGAVVAVTVHNYSEAPIHDVSVSIGIWRGEYDKEASPDERKGYTIAFLGPGEKDEQLFDVPEAHISADNPELSFLDSSGRRFERHSAQAQPERILREPRLAVRLVDGEVRVIVLPHESRLKAVARKVIPVRRLHE
jgi:hypothetical protein